MAKVAEINWDNFKESLNGLGVLCGFLTVVGTTISIYLRETIGIVVGVPDDIEVFGVPLNRREAFLAAAVIYLVQWIVLKKLIYLEQSIGKPGCEIEDCRALLLGSQSVFNPFARFENGLGAVSSVLGLFAFLAGAFIFPLMFVANAIMNGIGYGLAIAILYIPLIVGVLYKIYQLDSLFVGRQYASGRAAAAISSILAVALIACD